MEFKLKIMLTEQEHQELERALKEILLENKIMIKDYFCNKNINI